MKIVTVEEMLSIEKEADESGISYEMMMHNAGAGLAEWVNTHEYITPGVIGLIGAGNNGGDTLIALTRLSRLGYRTIGTTITRQLLMGSAIFSSLTLILFWDGQFGMIVQKGLIGLLINIVTIIVILV